MSAPYNYVPDPNAYMQQRNANQQTPYQYAQTQPYWTQLAGYLRQYNAIQDDKARGFDTSRSEAELNAMVSQSGLNQIFQDIIDPWGPQGEQLLRAHGYDPNSLTPSYANITHVREAVQQGLGKLTNSLQDANGNPIPVPSQTAANAPSGATASVPEDKIIGTSAWRKLHPWGTPAQGDMTPAQAGVSLTQQPDGTVTVAAPASASSGATPSATTPTAPHLSWEDYVRQQILANTPGAYMLNAARRAAFNHVSLPYALGPGQYSQAQMDAANNLYTQYIKQQQGGGSKLYPAPAPPPGVSMTVNGQPANPHPGPGTDPLTGLPNSVAQSAHDASRAAYKQKHPDAFGI